MKIFQMLLSFVVVMVIGLSAAAQEDWKFEHTRDGIDVYTRAISGSSIYAFKGVGIMDAPLEEVAELINDISATPQWASDMKEARILSKKDDYNMLVYNILDLPWPVSDRDFVVESKAEIDLSKGRVIICANALKDPPIPKNNECVRVKNLQIKYLLEYIDREHTRVTLTGWADPAGYLPAAVVNLTATKTPYRSLTGMRRILKSEKYIALAKTSRYRTMVEKQIALGNLKP
ncbi:MAG: hypothetical protein APR62_05530 [Smithella sp. SDB]|nr:MAG: hypothetical protein APR62_05530 [Smithella sp. SDB]